MGHGWRWRQQSEPPVAVSVKKYQPRIHAEELFVQTQLSDADSGMLEQGPPPLFAFPDHIFREPAHGDVFADDQHQYTTDPISNGLRTSSTFSRDIGPVSPDRPARG